VTRAHWKHAPSVAGTRPWPLRDRSSRLDLRCVTESEQGRSLAALSFGRPLRPGKRRLLATRLRRAGLSHLGDLACMSRFRSSSTSVSMTTLLRRLPAVQRLENRAPGPRGFVEMVGLGYAAEALTTLRCHSNLEELGLRHSPGSLAVVVSRCTTARYGEQAQYAVSQCVTPLSLSLDGTFRSPAAWLETLPTTLAEYSTRYYTLPQRREAADSKAHSSIGG